MRPYLATDKIVIDESDYWRDAPPIVGPSRAHPKEFVIIHFFATVKEREQLSRCMLEKAECQITIQRLEAAVWEFGGKILEIEEKSKTSTNRYLLSVTIQFLDAVGSAFFMMA